MVHMNFVIMVDDTLHQSSTCPRAVIVGVMSCAALARTYDISRRRHHIMPTAYGYHTASQDTRVTWYYRYDDGTGQQNECHHLKAQCCDVTWYPMYHGTSALLAPSSTARYAYHAGDRC